MDDRRKIDRGSIFIVVFLICAITLGYLMVGGTIPTKLPGYNNNLVAVSPAPSDAYTQKDSLQLRTFSGATITPYPTLAGGPILSSTPLQIQSCGHVLIGKEEPDILWAINLNSSPASGNEQAIKAFYADEYALTLGVGAISAMTKQPADHVTKPNVGDLSKRDPNKLPFAPSVFLTDTTTDPNSNSGDAENGGSPVSPSDVFGSWKALGANDPNQPNAADLAGGDPWPPSNGPTGDEGHDVSYTSEVIWKLSDLKLNGQPLTPGHTYRAEIVLHDGDSIGDIGVACIGFQMPGTTTAPSTQLAVSPLQINFQTLSTNTLTPQTLTLTNNTGQVVSTWGTNIAYSNNGSNWLTLTPTAGTNLATGQSVNISVAVNPANLAGGTYTATVTITTNAGTTQPVTVTLIKQ
jgi:hypothetical protein